MKIALNTTAKKEARLAEITAERDAAFLAGLTYSTVEYPCDEVFVSTVNTYILAYSTGELSYSSTSRIRLYDNTFIDAPYTTMKPLHWALHQHVQAIWETYWSEKDAIE